MKSPCLIFCSNFQPQGTCYRVSCRLQERCQLQCCLSSNYISKDRKYSSFSSLLHPCLYDDYIFKDYVVVFKKCKERPRYCCLLWKLSCSSISVELTFESAPGNWDFLIILIAIQEITCKFLITYTLKYNTCTYL